MGKITLRDIVSLPAFEEGGDLLFRATGMALSFYNEVGKVVFYPAECRCEFCHMIQSSEKGRTRCLKSDKEAARMALQSGMPIHYTCHAGLVDVVVPVVAGGDNIGCFYSGQSLLAPPTPEDRESVREMASELGLDPDALCEAYAEIPVLDKTKLELALGLLRVICHHIVEGEIALRQERMITVEQRMLRKAAEEKAELERNLREMELRLVSAQLNPHFLFNALNLIIGSAVKEDAPSTMNLVEQLAVLLRRSLTSIGSVVTLAEEIDSAKAYVGLFKARFEKEVDLLVDLPENLMQVRVPALILQPLVENALVHALPRCNGIFRLRISAGLTDGHVEIRVSDNGPGLLRSKLNAISGSLKKTGPAGKLTGLNGLNWRLRYYYPDSASLRLEQAGDGLTVVVELPSQEQGKSPEKL